MIYVRIRSYKEGSLMAEHLYLKTGTQQDAIDHFRKDMPEHKDCILVAEDYESTAPENKEHFNICRECGCVHFF